MKDQLIRFDWAIKRLLRQKANFGVLEGFLTVFLGEEVKIEEILESESNQLTADDKFNRVDIKAKNSKGEIIIVEIQNSSEAYYLERILYGVAKAVTEHIQLGNTYHEVKKVYSISILYFDLGRGNDYLYVGQNDFVGVHTKDHLVISRKEKGAIVQRHPSETFPTYYLVRVNNFNEVAKSPIEEWMQYLKEGTIQKGTKAPGLEEAREKLLYYNMSDAERHAYDEHVNALMIQNDVLGNAREEGLAEGMEKGLAEGMEKGLAEGMEKGLAEGMEKGRVKSQKETALRLLKMGLPLEVAAQGSALSLEEVKALIEE